MDITVLKELNLRVFLCDCRHSEDTPTYAASNQEIAIIATRKPTCKEAEYFLRNDLRENRNVCINVSELSLEEASRDYLWNETMPVLGWPEECRLNILEKPNKELRKAIDNHVDVLSKIRDLIWQNTEEASSQMLKLYLDSDEDERNLLDKFLREMCGLGMKSLIKETPKL